MSYCRFSSDDFQCDVYVYADVSGGYTVHVAGRRTVFKEPLPPHIEWSADNLAPWLERHAKVSDMCDTAEHADIDLPQAGEGFYSLPLDEAIAKLIELKGIGFNVPQYAIDALKDETE